jgi:uncharacterized protein (DUF1800 family)
MTPSNVFTSPVSRRTALQTLSGVAAASSGLLARPAYAQTGNSNVLSANAQAWRAMARVGYGPTGTLVRAVQSASSPREWALAQVDAAYAASQTLPRTAPDLAEFAGPLLPIFQGIQRERMERSKAKGKELAPGPNKAVVPDDAINVVGDEQFSRNMAQQAAAWRLMSCSQPEVENPLLARMTEFWFNHLNVYVGKGAVRPLVGHYIVHVARAHALGRFEDLLLASARHPAMLHYLDQAQSVAEGSRGPEGKNRGLNENYARELMELHTLGVDGGYTQTDVRELARILTGWTIGPQEPGGFRFAARMHDRGTKVLLGKAFPSSFRAEGEQEGEDAIRMLARHPSTAKRISLRLAQFFVSDNPAPALVSRLSNVFLATQGDLRAVMRTLLDSDDFWNPDNKLFKTPMDFACSALAVTQGAVQDLQTLAPERRTLMLTAGFLNNAGQPLHGWQTPDGYKFDAATWLAPEALTRRADYALAMGRLTPEPEFLQAFLSKTTRDTISQERPVLRTGLMLASPDFMYK